MSDKNNVIDFTQHKQARAKATGKAAESQIETRRKPTPVTDITELRAEIIKEERREVKRTILTEFVGAFVLVPNAGLVKCGLFDISENGIAFDMDLKSGQFKTGEEVAMRVYLNQQTYFPFIVKVQNVRRDDEEAVYRHGAHFLKDTINEKALHHFVKFIENVSASLERDSGDIMVSKIGM